MAQASVEAIERMSQNIRQFIEAENAIVSALNNDYNAIGQEWNDQNYEKLRPVLDDAVRELSGNQAKLEECVTRLQLCKTLLQDYLATQF